MTAQPSLLVPQINGSLSSQAAGVQIQVIVNPWPRGPCRALTAMIASSEFSSVFSFLHTHLHSKWANCLPLFSTQCFHQQHMSTTKCSHWRLVYIKSAGAWALGLVQKASQVDSGRGLGIVGLADECANKTSNLEDERTSKRNKQIV